MSTIKIITLDFGLLADMTGAVVKSMQVTIQKLGLPSRTEKECASLIALNKRVVEIPSVLFPELIIDETHFAQVYLEIFLKMRSESDISLYPNTLETLQELNRQGFIICVTSRQKSNSSILADLKKTGLSSEYIHIVGKDIIQCPAPSLETLKEILEEHELQPEEALIVGDSAFELEIGKKLGCKTCGVTYRSGNRESLSEADYIIDGISQLFQVVH